MIDIEKFKASVKSGKIDNCYIFAGSDERAIKEGIKLLIDKCLTEDEKAFNFDRFDGEKVTYDEIFTACETMPFMSPKRVVEVYRGDFLSDSVKDSRAKSIIDGLKKYTKDIPESTVLIMYYVFKDNREKLSRKLSSFKKSATVVSVGKLKGAALQRKVGDVFKSKGYDMPKSELIYFCSQIENDLEIINNEVDKLLAYANGKNVTRDMIDTMLPPRKDNDIFNLVEFLSQRKVKAAIDIYNELVFKGEKPTGILRMVQRQYSLLLKIKMKVAQGKRSDSISKELGLHPYICEKMVGQSAKFKIESLRKILDMSLELEGNLKSRSVDSNIDMEMFMVKTLRA